MCSIIGKTRVLDNCFNGKLNYLLWFTKSVSCYRIRNIYPRSLVEVLATPALAGHSRFTTSATQAVVARFVVRGVRQYSPRERGRPRRWRLSVLKAVCRTEHEGAFECRVPGNPTETQTARGGSAKDRWYSPRSLLTETSLQVTPELKGL